MTPKKLTLLAVSLCSLPLLSNCKDAQPISHEAVAPHPLLSSDKDTTDQIASHAYSHTKHLLSLGHRQPESHGLRQSKDYFISELAKHGWVCVEQSFTASTPKGPVRFSNVIARYQGKSKTSPWRRSAKGIIGAHIDSKIMPNFLGADDAASCVGALIALAEHFNKNAPEIAGALELVCFDGEEAIEQNMTLSDSLYGSRHYARALQTASQSKLAPYRKKPEFGIILDMIGHKDLHIAIPADTPRKLRSDYNAARKKLNLEKRFTFSTGAILDDHVPLNMIAKVPTIDLIGDFQRKNWWHTPNDNADLISKESLSMSIQMTLEILSKQF